MDLVEAAPPVVATRTVRSQYEDFLRHVRDHGVAKADRTGDKPKRAADTSKKRTRA